ncbi:MAG TPA: prolyl oligopeptidase family serine peptidase [Bryobacteraceae bacterium]|nr:prolyl oligopeptidase family serine peptidase [Bryobacteraceae bacterium]
MARFPLTPAAFLLACLLSSHANPAGKFQLTIDNIMRGPQLFGYQPGDVRWSGDGQHIYFQWKQAGDPRIAPADTYVVGRDGSGLRKLPEAEAKLAPPAAGDSTRDKKRTVYVRAGDIWLYDAESGTTRQITKTADAETNPHFSQDEKRVAFTWRNNLYVIDLASGALEEMTDIRPPGSPPPPGEEKGTPSQEAMKKDQQNLFETIRERVAEREEQEAKRKREHPRKPFILQAGQTLASLQLTPDQKYVLASIQEPATGARRTVVPSFVTESGYTEDIASYDKVGDKQSLLRLAILTVATGEMKWVDHGQRAVVQSADSKTPADRDVRLSEALWSDDGTKAVLEARAMDNKDRWILALDEDSGKTRVLAHDHDDAWIDGPGIGDEDEPGHVTLGWMKGDQDVYFQSERTGYSHLYAVPFAGGEPRALTSGNWEVDSAILSTDKSRFFLVTNEGDPGQQEVYEMSAEGGARTRLTTLPGGHSCVPSPDDRWFADVYSYTNKPPELYAQEARAEASAKKLTSSPAPEFSEYPWLDTPIVTFPARDGAMVRAHVYKPANYRKGGPAVLFVHGAGYLQNVDRLWSYYAREYMFHQLLMERGYLVADVDYRGSAGYGRDWRTAIYRHMGGKDLDDNVDAARWMVSQYGADPKRLGVYGGSYGGFITLMAMFAQPDVFAAGAALRPVTNWANYNDQYTSDILNLPQTDAEAYKKSSPIYFAEGLKGALLICHGMVDTNVHFQDTTELVQRLIELRKRNWELAVYPVENHGFVEPTSWADEYSRIFELFEKNLKPQSAVSPASRN